MYQIYDVEQVLDKRVRRGTLQYKIQWKGFTKSEANWVNEEHCDCPMAIQDYEIAQLRFIVGKH